MCIIISNTEGKRLDAQTIENCLRNNPDGVGFYDLTTGELRKTLDYDEARKWLESETPFVAHIRFATHGEVSFDNVHPFEFGGHYLLMMNGWIEGFVDPMASDTRQLVGLLELIPKKNWVSFLQAFSSRFCIIDTKHQTATTIGDWVERDGIQYSNANNFPKEEPHLLAVYGTLMSGYGNHDTYLAKGGAEFVDYGTTESPLRLCIDGFPRLLWGEDWHRGDYVEVEVYQVDDEVLDVVDRLEGHPHNYYRERCDICLYSTGEVVSAWVYFADEQHDTGDYYPYYDEEELFAWQK